MSVMLQKLNKKILGKIIYREMYIIQVIDLLTFKRQKKPRPKCNFIDDQNSKFNVLLSFTANTFEDSAQS